MTDVGIRDYLERRIDDLDKRVAERFLMNQDAVDKAEKTMNERLNSMNEFRDALRDQANRMATRVELEKLDEAVQELRRAKANLDGRLMTVGALVSALVAIAVSLIVSLVK